MPAQRKMPLLSTVTFEKWLKQNGYSNGKKQASSPDMPEIVLFLDEFTNYLDAEKGIVAAKLLGSLGYNLHFIPSTESGRTYISKGLLKKARKIANHNIQNFSKILSEKKLLVGIEPSALLTFRDEYPELASAGLRDDAKKLSKLCFTIEEFIATEFEAGRIRRDQFTNEKLHIHLHGHCQQKLLPQPNPSKVMLTIPENYTVEEIKSGCCGMAGAFGYEKRHYDLSMKIGEMVLFPAVRNA